MCRKCRQSLIGVKFKILPIGNWILREACRQGVEWNAAGLIFGRIAVNVSAMQFVQQGFPDLVGRVLKETGLPGHQLELELTESLLLHDESGAEATLQQLKKHGISLAIDDFGTGYSNLSRLKRFSRWGWLDRERLRVAALDLMKQFDVRAAGPEIGFGSLSGGNQQKAVLGRELGTEGCRAERVAVGTSQTMSQS